LSAIEYLDGKHGTNAQYMGGTSTMLTKLIAKTAEACASKMCLVPAGLFTMQQAENLSITAIGPRIPGTTPISHGPQAMCSSLSFNFSQVASASTSAACSTGTSQISPITVV
jgi:hypothetical protein